MLAYCKTLQKQIQDQAAAFAGYRVDTVYFGGGTPSFYGADRIFEILDEMADFLNVEQQKKLQQVLKLMFHLNQKQKTLNFMTNQNMLQNFLNHKLEVLVKFSVMELRMY